MNKIYVYNSEAVATSIVMTIYHLGHEGHAIGSAVVMDDDAYEFICKHTLAPKPVIVAVEAETGAIAKAKGESRE